MVVIDEQVRGGTKPQGIMSYLAPLQHVSYDAGAAAIAVASKAHSAKDLRSMHWLRSLFAARAAKAVADSAARLEVQRKAKAGDETAAWNSCSVQSVATARSHCMYFMLEKVSVAMPGTEVSPCYVLSR